MFNPDAPPQVAVADPTADRIRRFYEETPAMMHATDAEGRIALVSDRWLDRLGYSREEVVGRRSFDFLTPESRQRAIAARPRFEETGWVEDVEHDFVTKSGEIVHVLLSARSDTDADGTFQRATAVLEDVTEQKRLAREALELNERLSLALEASQIGIWDWNVVDDVLIWDDRMYRIYGCCPEDFEGAFEAWSSGLVPETREEEEAKVARALAGEEKFDTEFRIVHPNGDVRTIRGIGDVYRNEAGEPVRMLGANWDVTSEKLIAAERARLIEKLQTSNQDLESFAYTASHDLREPLRGMRNFAEFLLEDYGDKLDDEGRGYLATINKLGARLDAYLEDLLKYARTGQEELAYQEVDVGALLSDLSEMILESHERGAIQIECEGGMPTVHADPVKLALAFGNLIRNGLKYNDSALPSVRVTYEPDPRPGYHGFQVTDNGIGIKPEHRERVFTLFKRLHSKDAYGGGSGMGLTLVKRAVERHGGEVTLVADGSSGTTFRFTIRERRVGEDPDSRQPG